MDKNANNTILRDIFGAEKRWVNWRFETRDGKITKVPYQISGKRAEADDPKTWATYTEVKQHSDKIGIQFGLEGTVLGIDLDHWLNKESKKSTLQLLLKKANSYTEQSPSGEGLHIILALSAPCPLIAHKKASEDGTAVECYTERRYFTVTEQSFGDPKPVRVVEPQEALDILAIIGYPWGKDKTDPFQNTKEENGNNEYTPSDFEVLEKMFASKNGAEIKTLYHGDITKYNNDNSAADMAFVSHCAFWSGGDRIISERLWMSSPLGRREKTHTRKDYRDRTIAAAFKGTKEFYTWRKPQEPEQEKTVPKLFIHLADFVKKEFPPVRFVLEPFFETNAINMVSAPPNNWKTFFTLDVALAIAKGRDWVGTYKTEKQKVLVVNEEDTEAALQLRLFSLGAKQATSDVYFYIMKGYKLTEKSAAGIIEECKKYGITLVIFDSLRSIHNAKENDSTEMQEVMDHLKIFVRAGITVIFTHHHKKKPLRDEKFDDAEATRGSTAINAAVSGHISLEEEKREEGLFLIVKHLKSKATKKSEPIELRVYDTGGIRFEFGSEHQSVFFASQLAREKILKLLENQKEKWFSISDLVTTTKISEKNIRMALRELEDKSFVHVSTRTKLGAYLAGRGNGNAKFYMYRKLEDAEKESENIMWNDVIF